MRKLLWFLLLALPAYGQNAGPINSSKINGVFYANGYAGADASVKINACIAAVIAAGGGTCDARGLAGAQTLSQEIDVGSSSSGGINVELQLPVTMTWTVHGVTSSTACGIKVFSGGVVTGNTVGAGGNRALLKTDSSDTAMRALLCTDSAPSAGGSYVRISGLALSNPGATPFADSEASMVLLYDESQISYVIAVNYSGDAWHVYGVCCGTHFDHIQGITGSSSSTGSGVPFTIGKTGYVTASVTISDSTFNTPGAGLSDIVIQGGGSYTRGITFFNAYMEGNGSVDTTTPMVNSYASSVAFIGGLGNEILGINSTKPVFLNNGASFTVMNFGVIGGLIGVKETGSSGTQYIYSSQVNGGTNNIFSIPYYFGGIYSGGTAYSYNFAPVNISGSPSLLGNLYLRSISSPTPVTPFPTATTGGTLPDGITYGYKITAINSQGETLPSTEATMTTGTTGSNANTITVEWSHVTGATGYKVYGRTAGAETLLQTLTGDSTIFWIDTGSATPAANVPPTLNSTSPCVVFTAAGVNYWCLNVASSGQLSIANLNGGVNAFSALSTSPLHLNADTGANGVLINNDYNSGTGGLSVYSGGTGSRTLWGLINSYGFQGLVLASGLTIQNTSPTISWAVGTPGVQPAVTASWQDVGYSSGRQIFDVTNGSLLRFGLFPNGTTNINSGAGSSQVGININNGSGTGGLKVYSGGTTSIGESQLASDGSLYLSLGSGYYQHFSGTPTGFRQIAMQDASGTMVLAPSGVGGTTASIGGSSLAAGACSTGSVAIANLTTAMYVDASPTTYPGSGFYWRAYVSSFGNATVAVCAVVAGTPAASTYNIRSIE